MDKIIDMQMYCEFKFYYKYSIVTPIQFIDHHLLKSSIIDYIIHSFSLNSKLNVQTLQFHLYVLKFQLKCTGVSRNS